MELVGSQHAQFSIMLGGQNGSVLLFCQTESQQQTKLVPAGFKAHNQPTISGPKTEGTLATPRENPGDA